MLLLGSFQAIQGFVAIFNQRYYAGVSAILNLLLVEAYPVWSLIIITVDVVVIYALTVHGAELKS